MAKACPACCTVQHQCHRHTVHRVTHRSISAAHPSSAQVPHGPECRRCVSPKGGVVVNCWLRICSLGNGVRLGTGVRRGARWGSNIAGLRGCTLRSTAAGNLVRLWWGFHRKKGCADAMARTQRKVAMRPQSTWTITPQWLAKFAIVDLSQAVMRCRRDPVSLRDSHVNVGALHNI